jgi:predicted transcriptional regulator
MSTKELRKRLIEEIEKTDNEYLLREAYRLLHIEGDDIEIYKLNKDQKQAIAEARNQIKSGQFLTDEEANKEINEWLKK